MLQVHTSWASCRGIIVVANFAVILAAAGKSTRFGDLFYKKVYAPLAARPVWVYSAEFFNNRPDVKQIILVIDAEDREMFSEKYAGVAAMLSVEVTFGGARRSDSVMRGLEKVRKDIDFVAVHDAARPCLASKWVDALFAKAEETGAAILAEQVTSTVKRANDKLKIVETVPRDGLWLAQTPQVFRKDWLSDGYAKFQHLEVTDDAQLMEKAGRQVSLVPSSPMNLKITTKEDLKLAEQLLKALPKAKGFPF